MNPASDKVLRYLTDAQHQARREGEEWRSFGQISIKAGVKGPQHVSKALRELQKEGLVLRDIDTRMYRAVGKASDMSHVADIKAFVETAKVEVNRIQQTLFYQKNTEFAKRMMKDGSPFAIATADLYHTLDHEWRHYYAETHPAEARQLKEYLDELPIPDMGPISFPGERACEDPLCVSFKEHSSLRDHPPIEDAGILAFVRAWDCPPPMLAVLPTVSFIRYSLDRWELEEAFKDQQKRSGKGSSRSSLPV